MNHLVEFVVSILLEIELAEVVEPFDDETGDEFCDNRPNNNSDVAADVGEGDKKFVVASTPETFVLAVVEFGGDELSGAHGDLPPNNSNTVDDGGLLSTNAAGGETVAAEETTGVVETPTGSWCIVVGWWWFVVGGWTNELKSTLSFALNVGFRI